MGKILVIGASRGIGLETVKQAFESGHTVRAFARSVTRTSLTHPNLEKVEGDARSPDDLHSALDGVGCVIQTLGVRAGPELIIGPVDLFSTATRALLPVMETMGVRRLVSVTGFGAGDSSHRVGCLQRIPFRLILGRAYDDKSVQERLIRDSDLDWVIVRPGILTNGARTDRYRVLLEPDQWRNGFISRADVADFLIKQIGKEAHLHRTPVLAY